MFELGYHNRLYVPSNSNGTYYSNDRDGLWLPNQPLEKYLVMHFTQKLGKMLRQDFSDVKETLFLLSPIAIQKFQERTYILFKEAREFGVPLDLCKAGGFSVPKSGSMAVVPAACNGLTGIVETSLHEAVHLTGSDSCNKPNILAARWTAEYLTRLLIE
jgi:hypothetical protein